LELRRYWQILLRYWWIVLGLPLVVAMGAFLLREPPASAHQASMRLAVGVAPEERTGEYYMYDQLYTWQTAEYLADDFSEIVRSQMFADDVNALLGEGEAQAAAGTIAGFTPSSAATRKQHRILTVTVTSSSPEGALEIAQAAATNLMENGERYFAQLQTDRARIYLIDPPSLLPAGTSLRDTLDFPLRVLLGLAAGVGLAFLLDYLDDSVRGRDDLERMGIRVIGEVPSRRRWL